MNDKGKRYLTRFKAHPWLTSVMSLRPSQMFSNYVGSQINNYLVSN